MEGGRKCFFRPGDKGPHSNQQLPDMLCGAWYPASDFLTLRLQYSVIHSVTHRANKLPLSSCYGPGTVPGKRNTGMGSSYEDPLLIGSGGILFYIVF